MQIVHLRRGSGWTERVAYGTGLSWTFDNRADLEVTGVAALIRDRAVGLLVELPTATGAR